MYLSNKLNRPENVELDQSECDSLRLIHKIIDRAVNNRRLIRKELRRDFNLV